MTVLTTTGYALKAISASIPSQVELNSDINWLPESEKETLIKTIGIRKRRVSQKGQKISDLCIGAANPIFDDLKYRREDIGILLLITQTGDHQIPSTAAILQDKLGLSHDCLALEVNLGCSGYVYGLWLISTLIENLPENKLGLLLAGDISSSCLAVHDSGTVPLFSDAGSATIIQKTGDDNTWHFSLQNDGSGASAIKMFNVNGSTAPEFVGNSYLKLDGINIYNFSLRQVVPSIINFLDHLKLSEADIDFYVFHQASKIINEAMRRRLAIPLDKFPYSLEEYGNTSSATIPVTMVTQLRKELNNKSLFLSGFGTGLSWGSAYLKTGTVEILPLVVL